MYTLVSKLISMPLAFKVGDLMILRRLADANASLKVLRFSLEGALDKSLPATDI